MQPIEYFSLAKADTDHHRTDDISDHSQAIQLLRCQLVLRLRLEIWVVTASQPSQSSSLEVKMGPARTALLEDNKIDGDHSIQGGKAKSSI